MTKKELIELNAVLIKLSNFGKTKFKYAVLKNVEILKSNIAILVDLENEIKKHISSFEEDRNALILRIGKKNDDGSVFIDVADKDMVELFSSELTILIKDHSEEIGMYNTKMEEYQEILNEEIDETFSFKQLTIDQLPDEDISIDQLAILEKSGILVD